MPCLPLKVDNIDEPQWVAELWAPLIAECTTVKITLNTDMKECWALLNTLSILLKTEHQDKWSKFTVVY